MKGHFIKNYLCVFVNGLVENPAFNSQSKEALTTKETQFGSSPKISDAGLKALEKSEIVDRCGGGGGSGCGVCNECVRSREVCFRTGVARVVGGDGSSISYFSDSCPWMRSFLWHMLWFSLARFLSLLP